MENDQNNTVLTIFSALCGQWVFRYCRSVSVHEFIMPLLLFSGYFCSKSSCQIGFLLPEWIHSVIKCPTLSLCRLYQIPALTFAVMLTQSWKGRVWLRLCVFLKNTWPTYTKALSKIIPPYRWLMGRYFLLYLVQRLSNANFILLGWNECYFRQLDWPNKLFNRDLTEFNISSFYLWSCTVYVLV